MLIEVAIVPRSPGDQTRILEQLAAFAPEGPRFGVRYDAESHIYMLLGDSEEQLDALIGQFRQKTDLEFEVGAPHVSYRETLSEALVIDYTYKEQVGGSGRFAGVKIAFEPLASGEGFVFESQVVGDAIPKEFIPAVGKGIRAQKESGLVAGFPVTDFKATLVDGRYHEIDSDALNFEIAARRAFRQLAKEGVAVLLEPVMKVEVVTPEEFLGSVIGDLNARYGMVESTDSRGNVQVVTAMVPLANMLGYTNALGSMSKGRAQYAMKFHRYEQVRSPDDDDPTFRPAMGMRA